MSYYSSTRYRSSSGSWGSGGYSSGFSRNSPSYRSFGSGGSSRYSGGFYGSLNDISRPYSSSLSLTSDRRYTPARHKPAYPTNYWKYSHYADEDRNDITEQDKTTIQLDWLKEENRRTHRTNQYGLKSLIVRRGQEFKLEIQLTVKFDKTKDRLQLVFMKGEKPQESKGTLVRLNISSDQATASTKTNQGWLGYISSLNGTSGGSQIEVVIKPAADALIGKYSVKTKVFEDYHNEGSKRYIKNETEHLYMLFNPWCKDDQVYMAKEADLDEYVMNETGRIWVGNSRQNNGRPWNFGQFSKHSIEAALFLLDKSDTLKDQGHGNPTLICRTLSAMTNSNDDNGVLEGNWSGNYHGGTSPSAWNGSQAILEQYMLTKRRVRYGQCWVFSGVLTTLGRTLGIPTRSVTNFESAHDHDLSMTIDSHYSTNCSPLPRMDDSVWNFHVWNESWFQRPDLPDGYDGWQAYDATPQEASEGIMRCGPAPVKAIKEGNVYLGYDTKFVFAEVNGDRVDWVVSPGGDMHISAIEHHSIGKSISSKLPGSIMVDDLTHNYKYPEGSDKERDAVIKASKYSSRSEKLSAVYSDDGTKDIVFSYNGVIQLNGDITVTVGLENTSEEQRHVEMRITATAAYYTGIPGEELTTDHFVVDLAAKETKENNWSVKAASYLNIINEDAQVKLYLMAKVSGTKQVFTKSELFPIEKPELKLQLANTTPRVGEKFDVNLTMTNPVDVPLTEGVIRLEGPGIQKNMKIHLHKSIKPGEEFTEKVTLVPKYSGKREIIACFNSRQLINVSGAHELQVSE